jgi:hypothetical protein
LRKIEEVRRAIAAEREQAKRDPTYQRFNEATIRMLRAEESAILAAGMPTEMRANAIQVALDMKRGRGCNGCAEA